ncbi:MAG: NAD(P)/FAD-dependent oxidoreductase [Methanomicrobiales archaeon]
MKDRYDLLVIGGGPGGAFAAKTAAEAGLSVCIIEKRPAIGTPVRCAEGIGKGLLKEFIDPDDRWIAADIRKASIISPDGTRVNLSEKIAGSEVGYVLDRKVFDRELVWQAAEAGADVSVKTRAIEPILEDGMVRGAVLSRCGTRYPVHADVTIAADGVEAQFARRCGIDTFVPIREMMSCAQYLMTDIDIDPTSTDFFLGNEVAPEGYLWIFPKGERTANVGIGISGRKSGDGHRARDYLDRFVAERFPEGKTIEFIVGGVPVCPPLPCTVAGGLAVVGDAARVVDPLTGGGIYNAMYTGRLAAEVASDCISRGDCSADALMAYDRGWRESHLWEVLDRNYQVKEFFIELSDRQLNALAQSIAAVDLDEFSVLSLVKELIRRNPAMLAKLKALRKSIS